MVEKPKPEVAPSTLAIVGRYLLPPRVFDLLETTTPGAGGEIQLTDALAALLQHEPVFAHRFEGVRFDCGNKLGVVQATMALAVEDSQIGDEVRAYMRKLLA
jgi:UTP--glucose-1-phosphate uridylyltransferase